jgi:hypothetical protein
MDCRRTIGLLLLIGLALWGCSGVQTPSNAVWIAQPEFLVVDNQLLKTTTRAKKRGIRLLSFFLLTLTNKSNANLIIDWNASQYLFNNKPQGEYWYSKESTRQR